MEDQNAQTNSAPPTVGVSQLGLTMNANEIILTFGQSRIVISPETGRPEGHIGMEWFGSYSFSPTLAHVLHASLGKLIGAYEEQFGKIPLDPAAKAEMKQAAPIKSDHQKK